MRAIVQSYQVVLCSFVMIQCGGAAEISLHLHSVVDSKNEVHDPNIAGKWSFLGHDAGVEIQESSKYEHKVIVSFAVESQGDKRTATKQYLGRRCRLNDREYMELVSDDPVDISKLDSLNPLAISGMLLLSLEIRKDRMEVRLIDPEKLSKAVLKSRPKLDVLKRGYQLVVTAQSSVYQEFILQEHEALFQERKILLERSR